MAVVTLAEGDTVKCVVGSGCASEKGSAIAYWRRVTGKKTPSRCAIYGCTREVSHGSHVKLGYVNLNSYFWFIIPTCQKCNTSGSNARFRVKKGVSAVKDERIDSSHHIASIKQNMKTMRL